MEHRPLHSYVLLLPIHYAVLENIKMSTAVLLFAFAIPLGITEARVFYRLLISVVRIPLTFFISLIPNLGRPTVVFNNVTGWPFTCHIILYRSLIRPGNRRGLSRIT